MTDTIKQHPMFVMSMYMNKEDLYKAKAEYYMKECERLEKKLVIDTLNPNRRVHVNELVEQVKVLERRLEIADPDGESIDMLYDEDGNFIDYG